MTPLKSIRAHCLECMNGNSNEVRMCPSTDCPLYPLRFGKRNKGTLPVKSIRKRCLDCTDGAFGVKSCEFPECPLYQYRLGKNPNRAGIGNPNSNFKKNK